MTDLSFGCEDLIGVRYFPLASVRPVAVATHATLLSAFNSVPPFSFSEIIDLSGARVHADMQCCALRSIVLGEDMHE